ncbi:hypothetical protein FQA39_LY01009 [Lamprigera yunnana]|nr:hypothetical protein FQA39_LY01009 [Lamprigera yunnana]
MSKVYTQDFIAFEDYQPSKEFNLANSSTPQNKNKWHRRSSGSLGNSSQKRYFKKNRGGNSSFNKSKNMLNYSDISSYLHPSFKENPWAELEKKFAAEEEKERAKSEKVREEEEEYTNVEKDIGANEYVGKPNNHIQISP